MKVRKAGYTAGPVDAALLDSIYIERYQSSQTRLEYAAYKEKYAGRESRV